MSTFDLDVDHYVSAVTAKEMTKIDMNHHSYHRKFDGKLKTITVPLKKRDDNDRMIERFFKVLGYGKIDQFIDGEDIDPEDLVDEGDEDLSSGTNYTSDSESLSESVSDTDSESDSERKRDRWGSARKKNANSKVMMALPRGVRFKRR